MLGAGESGETVLSVAGVRSERTSAACCILWVLESGGCIFFRPTSFFSQTAQSPHAKINNPSTPSFHTSRPRTLPEIPANTPHQPDHPSISIGRDDSGPLLDILREYIRAERQALRLLYDLMIHIRRLDPKQDMVALGVDLRV